MKTRNIVSTCISRGQLCEFIKCSHFFFFLYCNYTTAWAFMILYILVFCIPAVQINKLWQDILTNYLGRFTVQATLLTGEQERGKSFIIHPVNWKKRLYELEGTSLRGQQRRCSSLRHLLIPFILKATPSHGRECNAQLFVLSYKDC